MKGEIDLDINKNEFSFIYRYIVSIFEGLELAGTVAPITCLVFYFINL